MTVLPWMTEARVTASCMTVQPTRLEEPRRDSGGSAVPGATSAAISGDPREPLACGRRARRLHHGCAAGDGGSASQRHRSGQPLRRRAPDAGSLACGFAALHERPAAPEATSSRSTPRRPDRRVACEQTSSALGGYRRVVVHHDDAGQLPHGVAKDLGRADDGAETLFCRRRVWSRCGS
jgi:hypothetical protein